MTKEEFDCYSLDDERFVEGGRLDALRNLKSKNEDGKLKLGESYRLGKKVDRTASDFFNIYSLLEQISENAYDEVGECADDFPDLRSEKRIELEDLIKNWLDENVGISFWGVENTTTFEVTEQDIKDME